MSQQIKYYPMGGGLDIVTPSIVASPGTARAANNYEADMTGYRRISGYERYDGRLSPTDAYNAAENTIQAALDRDAARAAITAVPGTGPVNGVWYYNGDLYAFRDLSTPELLTNTTFTTNTAGWTTYTNSTLSVVGGKGRVTSLGANHMNMKQVITGLTVGKSYRVTMNALVKGGGYAGAVRLKLGSADGLADYLDQTITGIPDFTFVATTGTLSFDVATFDPASVGGSYFEIDNPSVQRPDAGAMYVATPTGWQLVSDAFPPGGTYEFINYNFIGASAGQKMYGINKVGKGFQYDGASVVFITTGMAPDVPTKLAAHKRHLFFAFAGGSVQHSSIGDPLTWSPITGAGEIAVGDEVTDLVPSAPANLVIMSKNSVTMLYGNDATDWQLESLTNEAGALPYTAEKMGPIIYMDNRGIRSLDTTPSFGNFSLGTMTQSIAPLLRGWLASGMLPIGSCRVRARDLYRVWFPNGGGLSVFMGKKRPEVMPIDLGIPLTCVCSAETEDNVEKIWFGSDNGFVYQMDKGRSFDGEPVAYYLRLPFNHMGGPNARKRWHKVALEYDAASEITIRLAGEVDNADAAEPALREQGLIGFGGGGFWGSVNWDQFYWSSPVDGEAVAYLDALGRNLSLLLGGEEADEEPHTIQGLTLYYTVRGAIR